MRHTTTDAQGIITHFSKTVGLFRLKINLKKKQDDEPTSTKSHDISKDMQIEDQILTQINKLKYLGFTVARSNRLDAEQDTLTYNASNGFSGLRKRVWFNKIECAV